MKQKKWQIAAAVAAAVVALGLGVFLWTAVLRFSPVEGNAYLYIDGDDTADSVYCKLEAAEAPGRVGAARLCATLLGYGPDVKPGRYQTGQGISALRLVRNLRSGHQEPVKLVVPVAHTVAHLAAKLADRLEADSAALVAAFTDKALLGELGADTATAAALFVPNTYEVYWNIAPADLLRRMKKEFDAFWTADRRALAAQMELSPFEVATLASIVEKESANAAERPAIAGMYLNRLRQGMKLQADPTVKFALGNFGLRRILHEHLTVDNPYNTYRYKGLPPGPICIPSPGAIDAVLHYAHHSYLYMCAKEDFSGTHNFAVTYEEHLANARRYAEALDRRGIK